MKFYLINRAGFFVCGIEGDNVLVSAKKEGALIFASKAAAAKFLRIEKESGLEIASQISVSN
jgi:hypothetical protein